MEGELGVQALGQMSMDPRALEYVVYSAVAKMARDHLNSPALSDKPLKRMVGRGRPPTAERQGVLRTDPRRIVLSRGRRPEGESSGGADCAVTCQCRQSPIFQSARAASTDESPLTPPSSAPRRSISPAWFTSTK